MLNKNKEDDKKYYRISVLEDESHKTLWNYRTKKNSLILSIISICLLAIAIIYSIIAFTPIKKTIPGYPDSTTRLKAITNAIKIDSLQKIIKQWEFYANNLNLVILGEDPKHIDSVINNTSPSKYEEYNVEFLRKKDSILRDKVKDAEKFYLSKSQNKQVPLEGQMFFPPVKGVISEKFIPDTHPYIDIIAPVNSIVYAIKEGTIINITWSEEYGYIITVQHPNDLISIYKHNQKPMKSIGDKVETGTPLALIGNTEQKAKGPHLHFEMWHKGKAIDPSKYISF